MIFIVYQQNKSGKNRGSTAEADDFEYKEQIFFCNLNYQLQQNVEMWYTQGPAADLHNWI